MDVTLRPITDENRAAVVALELAPGQHRYVSTVAESMQEAIEAAPGRAIQWALYSAEQPVGFVMVSDEVDDTPGYLPHYLWKLVIDRRHQRRGYGTAALDLVVQFFRSRPGVEVLSTSAGRGEGSPIPFYERYGFRQTGETVFDDEALLELRISMSQETTRRESPGPPPAVPGGGPGAMERQTAGDGIATSGSSGPMSSRNGG